MAKLFDQVVVTDQKIGSWTVLGQAPSSGARSRSFWKVQCACGTEAVVREDSLKSGDSEHCVRCKMRAIRAFRPDVHGHTKGGKTSKEYGVWSAMVQRCTNPRDKNYYNYGGRGILVCKRWLSFAGFIKDMGLRPSSKHTLERQNNDKGYCPSNCVWADRAQQNRNSRRNLRITINGETLCITDWATRAGIPLMTFKARYQRGVRGKALFSKELLKRGQTV
jgi:hypothetical protein